MPDYMDLVSTSIAFIDTALDDRQTLHNGIAPGTEVITLDGVRDGVRTNHGSAGESQRYQQYSYHLPR